jgi:hypothetical protein
MVDIVTHTKYDYVVKKFIEFICKELDIQPHRLTIASYDEDDGNNGLCMDESDSEFIILVKETGRSVGKILVTIAHEMIHVKQHMKENLGWYLDNHKDIPYLDRWWEKEAFENAVILVEKFAKGIKG